DAVDDEMEDEEVCQCPVQRIFPHDLAPWQEEEEVPEVDRTVTENPDLLCIEDPQC
ncbi:unnamed protein product, partial [Symbiodinium pilosum]